MRFTLLICIISCYSIAQAQSDTIKSYTTAHLQGEAPKIDGYLNDPAWEQVPWGGGDFRQANPDAGKPASVQTKFKILYDAKNLYIAFLNLDPEPSKIVKRMSRRDGFEGDWVEINIDSYFDKRTAFSFTSSVSGVKGDEYVSNNGDDWDVSWDPIWYLKTSVNEEGWIAEVRIPLSQLRFAEKPELTWGFQITRRFFRKQERSLFQYIPPDAAGWVHLFAELRGIKGIKPQKQLEIQPYVVAKTERFEKEEGNPFATGKSSGIDGGLDAKIGITSDVTLDLTVNPDFGQVEADPSQVNLTAFELFFQERRPFFIEGNNTLNFPLSDFNDNNLFYSRRIGRRPQGEVNTDEQGDDGVNEYVKTTNKTTILGAAKLTGKNKKGFSWALLETVTSPEKATIDSLGYRRKQVIEPLTNYFVGRAQQDINKGNTIVGAMLTATMRSIDDKRLDWLHKEAYSGGLDFTHNWKERTYYVSAKTLFSHVRGSNNAMIATQTSSERYFQRPDNSHAHVDSLRKSLTGTGGKFMFGKKSGKLVFDVGLSWLSPQLELNDVGFLLQTDQVKQWVWIEYRLLKQAGIFRSQRYDIMQTSGWDFDKRNTSNSYSANTFLDFKNYWQMGSGVSYETNSLSNADLRGGPAFLYPGNFNYWLYISSDNRKKIQVAINPYWTWGMESYSRSSALDIDFIYRPINSLNITISPSISRSQNELQYVTTASINNNDRYLVANIDQTVARISLRMTYMITPNLSLQYWGQPFGAAGTYSNFKYIADARASDYSERFTSVSPDLITLNDDGQYNIDENKDGAAEVIFDKPDFNFGQFRSNAVIRWEYIPGSTLFLVWTHERNGSFYDRSDPLHEKYSFDFSQQRAHPVFLIKYTYRFVF